MRIGPNIADDLRSAVNALDPPRELLAKAAVEIEYLRAGYRRIMALSQGSMERGEARKIAEEYV